MSPREIRELRDLTRSRVHLLQELNRVKNRIGQMCEAGNIKVSSVATDLFGVSGRPHVRGGGGRGEARRGLDGRLCTGTLRGKKKQLERALEGSFTDYQRWTIPGVDRITSWTILAELGPDMSVFPDAHHAASWAGLCPGNRKSGGKRLPSRTRKANVYLRRGSCEAAWGASHSKDTYLAALYRRRQRSRLGHNQAIFALDHQLLLIAYTCCAVATTTASFSASHVSVSR